MDKVLGICNLWLGHGALAAKYVSTAVINWQVFEKLENWITYNTEYLIVMHTAASLLVQIFLSDVYET